VYLTDYDLPVQATASPSISQPKSNILMQKLIIALLNCIAECDWQLYRNGHSNMNPGFSGAPEL